MKTKDWLLTAVGLLLTAGILYGITLAVVLAWIVVVLSIVGFVFGLYSVSNMNQLYLLKVKLDSRSEFHWSKFAVGIPIQVLNIAVLFTTANLSLLVAYVFMLFLCYTFIYKVFKN